MCFLDVVAPEPIIGQESYVESYDLFKATVFTAVIALAVICVILLILYLVVRAKRKKMGPQPQQMSENVFGSEPTVGYPGKEQTQTDIKADKTGDSENK